MSVVCLLCGCCLLYYPLLLQHTCTRIDEGDEVGHAMQRLVRPDNETAQAEWRLLVIAVARYL